MKDHKGDILIIDDTPANLQVLCDVLRRGGYKARPAPNGTMGLRAARTSPPEMVLVDINMPDITGYEVCRQLKESEELKKIPVIFVSALSDAVDKVKAFAVGGVDFVTKPFQFEEVLARVETHLRLSRLKQALEEKNVALQESFDELQRLESLRDGLTHMIVHDLRSPLMAIMTTLESVEEELIEEEMVDFIEDISIAHQGSKRLMKMINELLDLSRLEAGSLPLDKKGQPISVAVEDAILAVSGLAKGKPILFEDQGLEGYYDEDQIGRVIQNFLGNALKFTKKKQEVLVVAKDGGDHLRIEVIDNGPGIPASFHEKIFEKFGQVEMKRKLGKARTPSSGVGLAFCKLAVEAHEGEIGVESIVGEGSTFWFTLPKRAAEQ